ncbi:MAG: phosphofructokinase [Actinomycetia bacterium]|nr:phosphofructokinase [Actinomycetes bacterium]
MRIGVLTGGGDCPGLNAVIRAIVRRGGPAHKYVGFRHGWRGVLEGETVVLDAETTRGLLHRGGTILGTSRTNPFKTVDGPDRVIATMAALGVDALVAIGGDDTLGAAERLGREHSIPIVGVPKTIDNDISATDVTFGFHTAVQVATDAIDRLQTTAESHDRVMVVEVMGRNAGWIAATAGLAGGADVILIPEDPFDVDQVCAHLQRRHQRTNFSIVVVAEGAVPVAGTLAVTSGEVDEFGHERLGGISTFLQGEIEARTGWETRVANLGHILRGGTPSAYDRVLATRFGVEAIDAVLDCDFGTMVALRGTDIVRVPIAEAVGELKTIDRKLFEVAEVFFG